MAVYERTYRPYTGRVTPPWSRFLILSKFGIRRVFSSRLTLAYFVACLAPAVVGLVVVYAYNNVELLNKISISIPADSEFIGTTFLPRVFGVQLVLAFFLVLITGTGLITADVANGAMPLYLSRPLTQREYIFGKLAVLAGLLSAVTWLPATATWTLQAAMGPDGWAFGNLRLLAGMIIGGLTWIATLSLIVLAISATARRRLTAMVYTLGAFLLVPLMGELLADTVGLTWGRMVSPFEMIARIIAGLYGVEPPDGTVPLAVAWVAIAGYVSVAWFVLHRKIRAYEIVR